MINTKLKIGDTVIVIAGKEKGKYGEILSIAKNPKQESKKNRVIVQGINRVKRFQPPTQENPKGGEILIERSIHLSNVMYYDSKAKKGRKISYLYEMANKDSNQKKKKNRAIKTSERNKLQKIQDEEKK